MKFSPTFCCFLSLRLSYLTQPFCDQRDIYVPLTKSLFKSAGIRGSIAHSIICTRLFRGKMNSDSFNGIEIIQGRWQHGEKVGYSYPNGLEKTLCKWEIYVPLVTKGLIPCSHCLSSSSSLSIRDQDSHAYSKTCRIIVVYASIFIFLVAKEKS